MSISANFPTSGPSLALNFVNSGQLDPRVTFSRASGATWFNSAGVLVGVDFSSTSLTVGTGWQTLTLSATAGVDRNWIVGAPVQLIASTGTNTMTGVVVSYTASTQTLVVSVASVVGSGTYSTWRVSNLSPRFDYNPATLAARGFLIEEARTNLLEYSDQFDDAAWVKTNATVTANAIASPDGTVNADKLVENTAASTTHQATNGTVKAAAATTYTASIFLKAAERTFASIALTDAGGFIVAGFNLSNGASQINSTSGFTGGAVSTTLISNGWYRVFFTATTTADTVVNFIVRTATSINVDSYTGDGTSGIYIWGAQLEAGAFPTSYIPTTTTALTRSADVASVNTLSPWFNATEGTIYAEVQKLAAETTAFPRVACFDDGSFSNSIQVLWNGALSRLYGNVQVGGATQADVGTNGLTQINVNKISFGYQVNNFAASVNGASVSTDVSGTIPSGISIFRLGRSSGGSDVISGYLRRITYYPRRLSDAELVSITS